MSYESLEVHGEGRRARRRKALLLKQFALLLIIIAAAYVGYGHVSTWLEDKDRTRLRLVNAGGEILGEFFVDVVKTPDARARGLMYRKPGDLKPHQGMLFVFPDSDLRKFWMRNTYIPLDMLFFDEQCRLVSKLENVPILNDSPRPSAAPAKYVLELNAGVAARLKIDMGSHCELPDSPANELPQAEH
ncbi:MAG: DUF192 domain-containing protein [Oligoflexia bacterium]|nr:DUF192 domain-containing protein [Oligoflexia bacterium]